MKLSFFVVMAKQTDLFGGFVSPLSKRLCIRDSDESDDKTQQFKKSCKEATSWPKVANASNSLSAALPTTWLKLVEEGMMCLLCEKYNKNKSAPSGNEIWSVELCKLFKLQSVHRHANSNMHKDAV